MQAVLVGLGDIGWEWYNILAADEEIDLTVVEKEEAKKAKLPPEIRVYASLAEAVRETTYDFLVNATPPKIHNQINRSAFLAGIPVLSEAPIAATYQQAEEIVNLAREQSVPFQIAENYRQFPIVRETRKYINQREIGELQTIQVEFRKNLPPEKEYFKKLEDPLLLDVSIHHFDLIRYLTGKEGKKIFAQSFQPKKSRVPINSNLYAFLELETGIAVNYTGAAAALEGKTSWLGDWKLEGTEGLIILRDHKLCLIKDQEVREITEFEPGLNLTSCLDNFIYSLTKAENFGTEAKDYIKTQQLVELARKSSRAGKIIRR